jgi:Domain of unknown function (DUF222)
MYEKSRSGTPDGDDPGRVLTDRSVRLIETFQGAGVLTGDLTPECRAVVTTVLDALAAPAGAQDTRTQEQRYHDARGRGDAPPARRGPGPGPRRAARQGPGPHCPCRTCWTWTPARS